MKNVVCFIQFLYFMEKRNTEFLEALYLLRVFPRTGPIHMKGSAQREIGKFIGLNCWIKFHTPGQRWDQGKSQVAFEKRKNRFVSQTFQLRGGFKTGKTSQIRSHSLDGMAIIGIEKGFSF